MIPFTYNNVILDLLARFVPSSSICKYYWHNVVEDFFNVIYTTMFYIKSANTRFNEVFVFLYSY